MPDFKDTLTGHGWKPEYGKQLTCVTRPQPIEQLEVGRAHYRLIAGAVVDYLKNGDEALPFLTVENSVRPWDGNFRPKLLEVLPAEIKRIGLREAIRRRYKIPEGDEIVVRNTRPHSTHSDTLLYLEEEQVVRFIDANLEPMTPIHRFRGRHRSA